MGADWVIGISGTRDREAIDARFRSPPGGANYSDQRSASTGQTSESYRKIFQVNRYRLSRKNLPGGATTGPDDRRPDSAILQSGRDPREAGGDGNESKALYRVVGARLELGCDLSRPAQMLVDLVAFIGCHLGTITPPSPRQFGLSGAAVRPGDTAGQGRARPRTPAASDPTLPGTGTENEPQDPSTTRPNRIRVANFQC